MCRFQSTLVLAEHDGQKLNAVTLHAVTAAKAIGNAELAVIVAGDKCGDVAKAAAAIKGVTKVLVAESSELKGFLPERVTPVLLAAHSQFKFTHIVAGSSSLSRSVLPRLAAKLDVSPISDVTGVKGT